MTARHEREAMNRHEVAAIEAALTDLCAELAEMYELFVELRGPAVIPDPRLNPATDAPAVR